MIINSIRFLRSSVLLVVLFLSTTVYSQTYIGDEKEINLILENVKQFSEYVMASDHVSIGSCYTKNAKILPGSTDIIASRDSIANYWKRTDDSRIAYHKITPAEIKITGNEAYDYGVYEGTTKKKDGTEVSWDGKYIIIWRKVGDDWKIYLDIWN